MSRFIASLSSVALAFSLVMVALGAVATGKRAIAYQAPGPTPNGTTPYNCSNGCDPDHCTLGLNGVCVDESTDDMGFCSDDNDQDDECADNCTCRLKQGANGYYCYCGSTA